MLGLKFGQTEKYTSFLDLPRYAIKLPVLTMGGISYSDCISPQRSAQSHNYLRNVFSKRPMKKLYENFSWELSSETNSHSKNEKQKVTHTENLTKHQIHLLDIGPLSTWSMAFNQVFNFYNVHVVLIMHFLLLAVFWFLVIYVV